MNRIFALLLKELAQLTRDKRLLSLLIVSPIIQLLFLGFAASLDIKNISVALSDFDRSKESRELTSLITNSGYFTITNVTDKYNDLPKFLDNNSSNIAIVIPTEFSNKLLRGETAKVQVILDGSEGFTTAIVMGYLNQIFIKQSINIISEKNSTISSTGGITSEVRAWYNPSLKSRNYMVPGILVLILMIVTTTISSIAIVKEKEIGTIEQLMVTPLKSYELIIGKLLPFIILGFINTTIAILVMRFGYGIEIRGSLVTLYGFTSLFLLTTLGLGLLVSTISKTQQQAMMVGIFFVMQPMMYLSGFAFPIENMPSVLQWLSSIIPMRHFLLSIRAIILKGVGFSILWKEAIILFFLGILILYFSIKKFKKKLD
ncbi:MAG: ABC transporter permease [Bacteroidetes bacterium]|nr:ABC transporter permease [Bacteroidota bacterium]